LAVVGLAISDGFDQRSFTSTVLIVTPHTMCSSLLGGSTRCLVIETVIASGFLVLSLFAFRDLWLIPVGMVSHGVFDFFHPLKILAGYDFMRSLFCFSPEKLLRRCPGFTFCRR
jgi:hypothetical protein